jgi:hypothetical protein
MPEGLPVVLDDPESECGVRPKGWMSKANHYDPHDAMGFFFPERRHGRIIPAFCHFCLGEVSELMSLS